MAKYHGATPTTAKVIGADMLNFKPTFDFPPWKKCKGSPVPGRRCASKTFFSSACKNLGHSTPYGTEILSSKKDVLGGYNLTFRSPSLLD